MRGKDDVCFVAWVQEDKESEELHLKKNTHFWKSSLDYSTKNYAEINNFKRLTRADYDKIV
ncbi:MAG: hypothetical protein ACFFG0_26110 [Candidatus Thorarchaeota archaeon]